ncbi:hypothetical protein [Breoghania sp.]|uniref:hypothetical protein n=1 Tax=Breoghania sp. TaxID=2065378 RepID=UPI003204825C
MNLSFALSAGIDALAGVLATRVTFTSYDAGVLMALKGFSATMLGGVGFSVRRARRRARHRSH